MYHSIEYVAEVRRLDPQALTAFALAHEKTYGIVQQYGYPEVSTWYVDKLCADFKAQQPAPAGPIVG
jgi:hypothetical protein